MGKQYVNELNKAIYNSPVLARSEILSSRKETLFDTIEGCFVRAGLLDTLAREMELQILKGDFSAMQLPPYQEPAHRPQMPGARRKEEERRARYKWIDYWLPSRCASSGGRTAGPWPRSS